MTLRTRRRARALPAALAVAAALLVPLPGRASAEPSLADARAQAAALATQVAGLQERAAAATEHYDGVREQLGRLATQMLALEERADGLRSRRDDTAAETSARARALYMSGGRLALYASVLDGQDIGDVLTRLRSIEGVLAGDSAVLRDGDARIAGADADTHRLDALRGHERLLEAQVAAAATAVEAALAEQQRLLDTATATVRRLVAEEQARREAAAAAAAAAELAAAQRAAVQGSRAAALTPTQLPPAPTDAAARAVATARGALGLPYQWGATGPSSYDCSGLTQWAYRQAGIALPRVAADQYLAGPHIPLGDLQPGDLVFWATDPANPATIHHVALYLGDGWILHAPHTGDVVTVARLWLDEYAGATRPSA